MLKFARHHPSPTGTSCKRTSSVDRSSHRQHAGTPVADTSTASIVLRQVISSGFTPENSSTTTTTTPAATTTTTLHRSTARRPRTSTSLERTSVRDTIHNNNNKESLKFTRGTAVTPSPAATASSPMVSPASNVRTATIVATSYARTQSPPPPPLPQKSLLSALVKSNKESRLQTRQRSSPSCDSTTSSASTPTSSSSCDSNYEAIFSNTLCRNSSIPRPPPPPPPVRSPPSTPVTHLRSAATAATTELQSYVNNHLYEPRSDFHRAVVRLVEKLDLQLLDTSSESGYGSDQDSLNNLVNQVAGCSLTSSTTSSLNSETTTSVAPPPLPSRSSRSVISTPETSRKKSVRFDSYVMLLQGLRERNTELVRCHIRDVCDEALATEEVVNEFLTAVIEANEDLIREMLAHGFNVNAADPSGMTPLHLAATFNYLPLVRLLLSHGAAIFARTHSSGNTPSELSSRRLPGFQACHAYLRCMEECLGVANHGKVFVTQAYRTARADELGVSAGETLRVLRKGDYSGSVWWWCENSSGHQGYVLQDLLALNKPTASIVQR